jgi:hypothetical protein
MRKLADWVYDGASEVLRRHLVEMRGGARHFVEPHYFKWWCDRAILAPRRDTVACINEAVMAVFADRVECGPGRVLDGCDRGTGCLPDALADLCPSGIASWVCGGV